MPSLHRRRKRRASKPLPNWSDRGFSRDRVEPRFPNWGQAKPSPFLSLTFLVLRKGALLPAKGALHHEKPIPCHDALQTAPEACPARWGERPDSCRAPRGSGVGGSRLAWKIGVPDRGEVGSAAGCSSRGPNQRRAQLGLLALWPAATQHGSPGLTGTKNPSRNTGD